MGVSISTSKHRGSQDWDRILITVVIINILITGIVVVVARWLCNDLPTSMPTCVQEISFATVWWQWRQQCGPHVKDAAEFIARGTYSLADMHSSSGVDSLVSSPNHGLRRAPQVWFGSHTAQAAAL